MFSSRIMLSENRYDLQKVHLNVQHWGLLDFEWHSESLFYAQFFPSLFIIFVFGDICLNFEISSIKKVHLVKANIKSSLVSQC